VWKPDEVERGGDDSAKDEVDAELEEEVAGDALRGVAHGLRHESEIAIAGETDEAVAEILALEEHEESEDDSEEGCGERLDDAAELVETAGRAADFADLERMLGSRSDGFLCGLAGRLKSGGGGGVDNAEFVGDLFEFLLKAADGGVAGSVEGFELGGDVVAVGGKVVGDSNELGEKNPGGDEEERGKTEDDDEGCGGTREAEALLEKRDDGSEEESEEDGDAEGEEEDFGEKENSDSEYGNGDEPELRQKSCGW